MKMLFFDCRKSEEKYFEKNKFNDFDITLYNESLNINTILTEIEYEDTVVISTFRNSTLSKNILKKFKNLRIIATRSYSTSHIDLEYCIKHNITVLNVEYYSEIAIAEYTIGLIIDLVRNLKPAMFDFKDNNINYKKYEGKTLKNYTLGIIGCGNVGRNVAKLAQNFEMRVLIHSYMKDPKTESFCKFVDLDQLLREADIITLHTPYNDTNYHLLSFNEFNKMKDNVFIINTARGELIDIRALYTNLISKKVRGAALDVIENETVSLHACRNEDITKADKYILETALIIQKMLCMNNVIITPHIGYNTNDSINYVLDQTFNNIRDYIKGTKTNRVC